MRSKKSARFPLLMNVSIFLAFVAFLVTLPIGMIVELLYSFGLVHNGLFNNIKFGIESAVIVICCLNILINQSHWLRLTSVKLYLCFFAYIAIVITLHLDEFGYVGLDNISAGQYFAPILFRYVSYCLIGMHLIHFYNFRFIILVATIAAGVCTLYFVDFTILRIDIHRYIEDANVGNYQFLGDSMAISTLLTAALFRNTALRLTLFSATMVIIFLIGSRTSFAVFGLASFMFIAVTTKLRWMIPTIAIFSCLIALYGNSALLTDLALKNPRMVNIFTDYDDDGSIIGRKDRFSAGWQDIEDNPITGRFGGQREIEGWQAYMHDVTSYWRQFGLVPFLILVCLAFNFLLLSIIKRTKRNHICYTIPFAIGVFLMIEAIISRSYGFSYIHMFFGTLFGLEAWRKFDIGSLYIRNTGVRETHLKRKRRRKKQSSTRDHLTT